MFLMSWTDSLKAAQPWIVGLGVPVIALTVPVQFWQASQIGALSAKADAVEKRVEDRTAALEKRLEDRTEIISKGVSGLSDDLRKLDQRLADRELDPNKLLARVGGVSEDSLRAAFVSYYKGEFYVIPSTKQAHEALVAKGFRTEPLSPTISGFKVESANASVGTSGGSPAGSMGAPASGNMTGPSAPR